MAEGDSYSTSGDVTIKGKPSPLELVVSGVEIVSKSATFKAKGIVDRNALGVDKMPSCFVGQNLTLDISATVLRST